ncbi:sigma-70 family RNA polymerase sigma factor [Ferrimicrobium sp.]|uniref:RNA polymerase sigma factor n=1 Tax=Ferrimicrobium sp. TaxID=2926050 RepID=UPI002615252B|nr:sigma-70 family RNA polymerase sigma factor [Ferrimicrobium sp.]
MLEVMLQDLFESFSPLIRAQVFSIVGNAAATEDLVQATFLAALDHKDSLLLDEERLKGWLLIVARNRAIDYLRRSHQLALLDLNTLDSGQEEDSSVLDRMMIDSAMDTLSDNHRQVIQGALVDGTPLVILAAKLGVPEGTIRSRLHYAIKILRSELQQGHETR